MMDQFEKFSKAVRTRFAELCQSPLFILDIESTALWEVYLKAFPEGSNPIFRKRTEHDCSCCRHFIRDIGAVVAIQNGAIATIWDLNALPEPYQTVADKVAEYVRQFPIRDIYLTNQAKHGVAFNHQLTEQKTTLTFHHFVVEAPKQFVTNDVATKQGTARTTQAVLLRGVMELDPKAVVTVSELITNKMLYRGQEFHQALLEFMRLQGRVLSADTDAKKVMITWENINNPVARLRNTALGTLLQDLSEGVDLEKAVKSYENMMAPANYKRPTALITKSMVDAAVKTIEELGLEEALERRHAKIDDVSVNSVLFVDNSVRGKMKGGKSLTNLLMEEVKPVAFDPKNATEISIEAFLKTVLPKTTGLQLYLDNNLTGNLMSLTAPVHQPKITIDPHAGAISPSPSKFNLFKWDNDFAWSYEGNVTDSIKERVKRAGGRVENVLMRVSLAWNNTDDLDLHVIEPNGNHIHFANKSYKLDVDMNVSNPVRDPVENVRWAQSLAAGTYSVSVNQFTKRESVNVGFTVEIEHDGELTTLKYEKAVASKVTKAVAKIVVSKDRKITITPAQDITSGTASREIWGLKTQDLVRVNAIVLSPNYWDDNAVGNKHWFFLLEGCNNPLPTRGIYNEFLHSRLEPHRRVFEVLGDKAKCQPSPEQLSGVGFSSTQSNKVSVIAMGPNQNRPYTIVFNKGEK